MLIYSTLMKTKKQMNFRPTKGGLVYPTNPCTSYVCKTQGLSLVDNILINFNNMYCTSGNVIKGQLVPWQIF